LLWYPWTIAAATALEHDPGLGEYQHARFASLLTKLLERGAKVNDFVENFEWTYPIAETLFAEGYYLSRDGITIKQK
jgi:hypothetical protein